MGLAREFQKRGVQVLLVSTEFYRPYVESFGIPFASMRPDMSPEDPEILEAVLDQRRGPMRLHKDVIFRHTRIAYSDLEKIAEGFDVIVTGALGFFVPTLAEKTKKPWVSVFLSPILLWSAYDPPIIPQAPILTKICRKLGPGFTKLFFDVIFKGADSWAEELHRLRKDLGLPRSAGLYRGMMDSPYLNVMLFSKHFAPAQIDWPKPLLQPGFVAFDGGRGLKLDAELENFLSSGEAPVMFTLGSTASERPGQLLRVFREAALKIPYRALFVVGKKMHEELKHLNSDRVFFAAYVPYSEVMSLSKLVVHQGGVGTTAQAMKSARPSLIVAQVNDQPDNGRHLARSGAGDWLHARGLKAETLAQKIVALASDPACDAAAKRLAADLKAEDAVGETCTRVLALVEA
jgi:UDP:flavonoid glycosyltransferase YjiC (YdhE family)